MINRISSALLAFSFAISAPAFAGVGHFAAGVAVGSAISSNSSYGPSTSVDVKGNAIVCSYADLNNDYDACRVDTGNNFVYLTFREWISYKFKIPYHLVQITDEKYLLGQNGTIWEVLIVYTVAPQ
jgi:hypothetical protein